MEEAATAASLREIVECLTEGIVLLDREARCRYVNPEAARIFGGGPADFVGKVIGDVAPSPIGSPLASAFVRILAGEEVILARSHWAQERWYEALARPMGDQVLLLLRDITERLQAESARRQSEERFRLLVHGVRDHAIVMVDPKGQVASWNAGAERLFGYRAEEILGKTTSIFFTPEDVQRGVHRTVVSSTATRGTFQTEGWRVRKDGSTFLRHRLRELDLRRARLSDRIRRRHARRDRASRAGAGPAYQRGAAPPGGGGGRGGDVGIRGRHRPVHRRRAQPDAVRIPQGR
jgi:PAS domain S-box-containing protein